ncbi:putative purine nucleoside permease [Phyllosticta citrichinensis]|uniref:Purine nucleoside permease n=1 Tax=Phyllosticta citrichinensis TaxID=1130410 RepID=A0ABR1Y6V4_9PEZI
MRFSSISTAACLLSSFVSGSSSLAETAVVKPSTRTSKITPKVFIITHFNPEAAVWWNIPEFNLLAQNITVPGFSPLFPEAHCTADGSVCQLITGEGEINAAVTLTSLVRSGLFNLRQTYFLTGGIGGINPEIGTTASVTFARFSIQVALQYELDAREKPENFSTGYFPQDTNFPDQYPQSIYGTEVFEVNDALRQVAIGFATKASLNDSAAAATYRANYAKSARFAAAAQGPRILACDSATADTYFSGALLSEAFANYTKLVTNGTGQYCTSGQEDNATLEALLRGAASGLLDFARIIVMRSASDFDFPPPGQSAFFHLVYAEQGGFEPAVQNLYRAGVKIVGGIVDGWDTTFSKGVAANNYVGDIFGTLGGKPDFGPGSKFDNKAVNLRKRGSGRQGKRTL